MKKCKTKYELGGSLNGNTKQETYGNIGNIAGMALTLAGIPGMGPVLSGLGSKIGANQDMSKAIQDHFNSLNKSSNPYGNYALGGEIQGDENLFKYKGNSHINGGINVSQSGLPTENSNNEVEGGETTLRVGTKGYVFSKSLKIK